MNMYIYTFIHFDLSPPDGEVGGFVYIHVRNIRVNAIRFASIHSIHDWRRSRDPRTCGALRSSRAPLLSLSNMNDMNDMNISMHV